MTEQNQLHIAVTRRRLTLPDAGMFLTEADEAGAPPDGNAAVNRNDGQLWFSEVGEGGGISVHGVTVNHIVGNAAEFVCDAPEVFAGISAPSTALAAAKANAKSLAVMGGSALSPARYEPSQRLSKDWSKSNRGVGFSDVGIRLAFTAEGGTAAAGGAFAKAIRDLNELKFLPPPGGGR